MFEVTKAVDFDKQAFVWNPSIIGIESEDTIIYSDGNLEILTIAKKGDWPLSPIFYFFMNRQGNFEKLFSKIKKDYF